ncbi:MAG: class I SAM-dependent methyltransferase [Burkholderiales bacterium]|nr:class I SAM-dependent methyltransferase [Burkholderiales bacterium]
MTSSNSVQHGLEPASAWVKRWAHLLPLNDNFNQNALADVLDLACGHGRHMQFLAGLGFKVLGVDRNAEALRTASQWGKTLQADIENAAWPLEGRSFKGVVVTNYLWRDLFPQILNSVAEGGVLIYETFSQGNQAFGKPSRPEFLLQSGELLQHCKGLQIVAFEEGFVPAPDRCIQRVVAIRVPSSLEPAALSRIVGYP